jgi:glucose/arabinose dehydrogenase
MSSTKRGVVGKIVGILTGTAALAAGTQALAQEGQGATPLTTVRVASGLTLPTFCTNAPGDFNRLFALEQRVSTTGRIRIINDLYGTPTLAPAPFLSVTPVATGNEQGLLGLAFHPNYATNGYFYIYFTMSSGSNAVRRYRANGGPNYLLSTTADAASATDLLVIPHPSFTNHNGGWIAFGPDGYLYISTGDGGSANDPPGNAQNINELKGKMLRIDVDGADNIPGNDDDDGDVDVPPSTGGYTSPPDNPFFGPTAGRDEIWAIGLRNPWRNSFDSATGDLYIGDVGQDAVEEVDVRRAGIATVPVFNFGWRCMEGTSCTGLSGCTCNSPALTLPITTYTHTSGNCSITGGEVYRGCAMPDMQGIYFFADYCSNQIWSLRYNRVTNTISEFTNRTTELDPPGASTITSITAFGHDALGEIYIVEQGGEIWRIAPTSVQGTDCNANNRSDACEIRANPALDCDHNGVLDSCELAGHDCNGNGVLDSCDIAAATSADCFSFGAKPIDGVFVAGGANGTPDECECVADWNRDGTSNSTDVSELINTYFYDQASQTTYADINCDGVSNSTDVSDFINIWFSAQAGLLPFSGCAL